MNKVLIGLIVLSAPAFAKISIFSNQAALEHILESRELSQALEKAPLQGLQLVKAEVDRKGTGGLNTTYRATLMYVNLDGALPTRCNVAAETKNEKQQGGRPAITSSRLSRVKVSKPTCAQQ